jgi:hypothetical protein
MALRLRPHTVSVFAATENVLPSKVVAVPGYGSAVSVACQVTPAAKGVTYTRTGLDLNNPHTLMCELSDAPYLGVGTRVLFGSRWFSVAAPVELMQVGGPADHARSLLEELTAQPEVA